MKITRINKVSVETDHGSIVRVDGDQAEILLMDGWSGYTLDQVRELRDALNVVLVEVAKATPTGCRQPRTFGEGDDIPSDVQQIKDRDGDIWTRDSNYPATFKNPNYSSRSAFGIIEAWGPVTEVLS